MSQGDFDSDSPWAWSDKTIVGLMKELDKVRQMVHDTPNNYQLGAIIRAWANGDEPPTDDCV